MASDVAISSRHWSRCNKGGPSSSGLIQCSSSEGHSLDGVKWCSYTMCLISDWGLQRCLGKCAWLCMQKAGKERERLRKGREDRRSDERNKGEEKKNKKSWRLKCWKYFQENTFCSSLVCSVGFAFVSTSPSDSSRLQLQSNLGLTVLWCSIAWAGCFTDECSSYNDPPQSILASALAPEEWCFPPDIENLISIHALGLRRRAGHVTVMPCP